MRRRGPRWPAANTADGERRFFPARIGEGLILDALRMGDQAPGRLDAGQVRAPVPDQDPGRLGAAS